MHFGFWNIIQDKLLGLFAEHFDVTLTTSAFEFSKVVYQIYSYSHMYFSNLSILNYLKNNIIIT